MTMTTQIFILDDDESVCNVLAEMVKRNIGHCEVFAFTNSNDMLSHSLIHNTDIFVVDVNLKGETGCDVMNKVVKKINRATTCLFISGTDYKMTDFNNASYTFDFISKPPNNDLLFNRIRVLLQVAKKYKNLEADKHVAELSLFELINYSNFYVIILSSDMRIKLCSSCLAKDLGFTNPAELIGKCWLDFVPHELKENIDNVFDNIMEKVDVIDDFREVTNPIISKRGEKIIVKWFNTKITNGKEYTFSIGIPISKPIDKENDISSIRSYWSDIIESDRTTIDSLKNILKNNPQQKQRDSNTCSET